MCGRERVSEFFVPNIDEKNGGWAPIWKTASFWLRFFFVVFCVCCVLVFVCFFSPCGNRTGHRATVRITTAEETNGVIYFGREGAGRERGGYPVDKIIRVPEFSGVLRSWNLFVLYSG